MFTDEEKGSHTTTYSDSFEEFNAARWAGYAGGSVNKSYQGLNSREKAKIIAAFRDNLMLEAASTALRVRESKKE